jgi:hypothetical protein
VPLTGNATFSRAYPQLLIIFHPEGQYYFTFGRQRLWRLNLTPMKIENSKDVMRQLHLIKIRLFNDSVPLFFIAVFLVL